MEANPQDFESTSSLTMKASPLLFVPAIGMSFLSFADAADRKVEARVVFLEREEGLPSAVHVSGSDDDGAVAAGAPAFGVNARAVTCPVGDDGMIRVLDQDFVQLASATLPTDAAKVMLFMVRNSPHEKMEEVPESENPQVESRVLPVPADPTSEKKGGGGFRAVIADESAGVLAGGSSFICNMTVDELRVRIGEREMELQPGAAGIAQRPEEQDEYNMAAMKLELRKGDDGWKPLKDTTLRFSGRDRYYVFCHLPPNRVRARVKIYRQPMAAK